VAAGVVWAGVTLLVGRGAAGPIYSFSLPSAPDVTLEMSPAFINHVGAEFLDHRTSDGPNILLARSYGDHGIYHSTDMGETWTRIPTPGENYPRGFVTGEGCVLLWNGHQLHLRTLRGKLLATQPDAPWPWLGSWGIGQAGSTIMYAEYSVFQAKELRVFRSGDGGRMWSVVFRQTTDMSDNPQIRHFHLVQPDPYYPNHWYLSSGDLPKESRVWRSVDDGRTWVEVTDPEAVKAGHEGLHRFTATVFTPDCIYWATDDLVRSTQAKVVRATRGTPLHLEVLGPAGDECMRNAVVTDHGIIFISEHSVGRSPGARVYVLTPDQRILQVGTLTRHNKMVRPEAVTTSLSSRSASRDQFFTWGCGELFTIKTELYRWEFRKLPGPHP